jgi:uncharacterized protein YfbU (UPF0304 family)
MTIELDNSEPVTLTKAQRLILANQYTIMALLDKKNAKEYEKMREAVTDGFAEAIDNQFNWIFDGLSAAECNLVISSLAMYDALQRSYKELGDQDASAAGIKKSHVTYPGFDGNNETPYMAYARYVRDEEQRFDYLDVEDNCNSHRPMIGQYRAMLQVWEDQLDRSYDLAADQMRRLLETR